MTAGDTDPGDAAAPTDAEPAHDAAANAAATTDAGTGRTTPGLPAATPRQAILAVAVLCGLCLVIGIVLGRTL